MEFLNVARFAVKECDSGATADCLDNSVHLWWVSLPSFQEYRPRLFQTLSPRERAHGSKFKSQLACDRYTITRGILRALLSHYSRQSASTIPILTMPSGKPFAIGEGMPAFSVSHSADVAVIAFAQAPLGVDVESIHEIPEMLDIAEQFFSPREFCHLTALPLGQRQQAFFSAWTEKEAYLKATGEGLTELQRNTHLPLPRRSHDFLVDEGRCRQWQLSRFEREGYAVAIVTSSLLSSLTFHKFVPDLLGQVIEKAPRLAGGGQSSSALATEREIPTGLSEARSRHVIQARRL